MTTEPFPFQFPDAPGPDASTQDTLRYMQAVLEVAMRCTAPMSQRMKVLTSLSRFAQRAIDLLDRVDRGDSPLGTLALALEWRDLARIEQKRIDDWLHEEAVAGSALDVVQFYKVRLAIIEGRALVSLSYVGTDREADPESGGWWARATGQAIMELAQVAPHAMALPADSDEYKMAKQGR